MAQDFERHFVTGVGTIAQDIPDGTDFNSDDAIVGIHLANTTLNTINASVFMTMNQANDNTGADFTYVVTVAGGKFVIDSVSQAPLTLYRGNTYTFDLSSNTISSGSHVFALATATDAAGSSQYTTGVTTSGTQGQAGATLTLQVTDSTPATLHYYCTAHNGMGAAMTITNAHFIIKDAPIPAGSSLQVLDGGAKMVVQNGDRLFVKSDTASSLDAWVSVVDAIST
tara:strand:+ start:99 stop:776 length:678 start_codon:yes stop_codon:yes gene_type:complete